MFRNALLTFLVTVAAVAAIELAPEQRHLAPSIAPGPDDRLLATRVAEFSVHGVPAPKAIELLAQKSGVPIQVEWQSFNEYRSEPSDLDLHDVRLDDAVAAIFTNNRFNPNGPAPAVNVDPSGKAIIVTATWPTPTSWVSMRVYDVRDLLTDQYWGKPLAAPGLNVGSDRGGKLAEAVSNLSSMHNLDFCRVNMSHYSTYGPTRVECCGGNLIVIESRRGHQRVATFLAGLRGWRGVTPPQQ